MSNRIRLLCVASALAPAGSDLQACGDKFDKAVLQHDKNARKAQARG